MAVAMAPMMLLTADRMLFKMSVRLGGVDILLTPRRVY
jgi:hypothetical protein